MHDVAADAVQKPLLARVRLARPCRFVDLPASLFRPASVTPLRARDRIVGGTSVDRAAQGSGAWGWTPRSHPQPCAARFDSHASSDRSGARARAGETAGPRTSRGPPFPNRRRSLSATFYPAQHGLLSADPDCCSMAERSWTWTGRFEVNAARDLTGHPARLRAQTAPAPAAHSPAT
jgi:hypothetical protein